MDEDQGHHDKEDINESPHWLTPVQLGVDVGLGAMSNVAGATSQVVD